MNADNDPSKADAEPRSGDENAGAKEEAFAIDLDALTEDEVRELLEKARKGEEHLERLQRLQAEHENYRKRMVKESAMARTWAVKDFALDILPVVDNLERALVGPEEEAPSDEVPIREGIRMVLSMLQEALKHHGIEKIEAKGRPFDPAWHEAAGRIPTDEAEPGTVVEELETGYALSDIVVRPARVLVSQAPPAPEPEKDEEVE